MSNLGFIGLGLMGRAMAANLIAKGHHLTVWNRTRARAVGLGAVVADSPAALAASSDVVFLCVSDTPDVEAVVFGDGGVAEGLRPGALVVDHSTISPKATGVFAGRIEGLGGLWLDAPVSGGSEGAARGSLAVMAGGPTNAFERAVPYMEAYSTSIVHVGEQPGAGQMAKLVNQVLVVVNQLAASEGLMLADAAGLDLETTIAAIEGGAAGSWMLSNRGPQMTRRDWTPGFTIDLQLKDLRLALEAAEDFGVALPGARMAYEMYRELQESGLGGEGNHALVKALEKRSGRRLGDGRADPGRAPD